MADPTPRRRWPKVLGAIVAVLIVLVVIASLVLDRVLTSEARKQAETLSLMTERARFMARQPGFISISLHRSLDGRRIVNYVQWQSRDLLQSAHKSPEFRKEWGKFDQLADEIDPHLYEVVHVMDSGE